MNVERTTNGIVVSDIIKGYREHRLYQGYSVAEAKRKFKAEFMPACHLECKKGGHGCEVLNKESGWHCSRSKHHKGKHVACSEQTHELEVW